MHPVSESQTQIEAYAIRLMYERLGGSQLHLFLMPAVFTLAFWDRVDRILLLVWVTVISVVYMSRYALSVFYRRVQPDHKMARRWGGYMTATSVVSGIGWGFAGIQFYVSGSAGHQVLLYTSIMGLAAGSIIVTAYWISSFYAYAVPAISLSALRLAMEGTFEYQGLALLMMMYLSILVMVGRFQKQSAYEAIRLRFENLELVEQLRQQKNVAEQASVAKSRFLAAASHDLRQPLHALGLFAAALHERIQYPQIRGIAENIRQGVSVLESLLNALLDVSRLDAGVIQPRITAVGLQPLMRRLSDDYATQARDKGLEWKVECEEVSVRSDPALLETMLRNLMTNAIRYTREGVVRVRVRSIGDEVAIDVEDTGIGIAVEHHDEVFREFFQLQNPERDRAKGLGLGLAIVKRLAELLKHKLELESQVGAGSRFRLVLPGTSPVGEAAASPLLTGQDGAGALVMVIDDELSVREAMQLLLSEWGYVVMSASSEGDALDMLKTAPVAIIADYRLREERTGVEAIRSIQACWGRDIPALVVTGDTAPERLREVGASGYALLHKPVSPGRLRAFLRQATRKQEGSTCN